MNTIKHLPKHFTVSAYIANPLTKKVVLVYHKMLDIWIGPGGHIDKHEGIEEALTREIEEETGIRALIFLSPNSRQTLGTIRVVRMPNFIEVYTIPYNAITRRKHEHINLVYYAKTTQTKLTLAREEHHDVGWFTLEEAKKLKTDKATVYHMGEVLKKLITQ